MSLGITEIILILIVVIVLFGGKKIPELARGLGKAQAEYKKAKETIENELSELKSAENKTEINAKKPAKTVKRPAAKKASATRKTATTKKATAKKPAAKKTTAKAPTKTKK